MNGIGFTKFNRNKKGGLLKVVFILFLIFAILAAIGAIKINFMLGEQLRLTISPEYSERTATSPGNITFEADIKLYNKFLCEASCKYTLTDMSNNILIDSGTFESKAFSVQHYSQDIPLTYNGYGTNLYLYTVDCINTYTTVCPASDSVLVRKSLLALSYGPSEEQLSSLESIKLSYELLSQNFIESSNNVLTSGKILSGVNFPFDRQKYPSLESGVDNLDDSLEEILSIWRNDDYTATKSFIANEQILEKSQSLLQESSSYDNYLHQTVYNHNFLVDEFSKSYFILEIYHDILSLDNDLSYLNYSEQAGVLNFILRTNSVISSLNSEKYNYTVLLSDAGELKSATPDLNNVIIKRSNQGFMENYAPLYVYSNLLCRLESAQEEGESSLEYCGRDYSLFIKDITAIPKKFDDICLLASDIDSESGFSESNDSVQTLLLQYKLLLDYESMINEGYTTADDVFTDDVRQPVATLLKYKTYIINTLNSRYGITDIDVQMVGLNVNSSDITLSSNSLIFNDVQDIVKSCGNRPEIKIPELTALTSRKYNIPEFETPEIVVASPPVSIPQCCVYDKCQSCEKHNTKNPLVMLHGHSLNKEIDAYRSIESFDGFEYAFMKDNLYFLTGMMIRNPDASEGLLGRYAVPVAIKPTYYLEAYNNLFELTVSESKNENIDTYALRLKESIDYVLYLTGNDKVDIVAHSMGGLVVRRYMQIFGTKNVGTVILIGTPNNGINERTYALCKIFGAEAECTDMRSEGLFINKLNDPSNQPDMRNMYLVIGKGCDTEGVDGDGVVTADSVLIKGFPEERVLYLTGNCSEIGGFHRQLLDAYHYPEVYEFVKDKLSQTN